MSIDDWPTYLHDLTRYLSGDGDYLGEHKTRELLKLLPRDDEVLANRFIQDAQKVFESETLSLMMSGKFFTQSDRTKMRKRLSNFAASIDKAISKLTGNAENSNNEADGMRTFYMLIMLTKELHLLEKIDYRAISQTEISDFQEMELMRPQLRLVGQLVEMKDAALSLVEHLTESNDASAPNLNKPKKLKYPVEQFV